MNRLRAPYFIVANTAILVLVVELGTHAAVTLLRSGPPEVRFEELPEPVRRNYAHMRPDDVEDLLRVTAALRFRFAATGGFVHEERKTRFVNINHHGIRANGTGRREIIAMEGAVWALGGSTTFGSGVADHETIPAQLERILGQPVINLGVRGDGSLMENRLLNYYLRIGYRPAMAIFLDGINEACRSDVFGNELSDLVARSQQGYQWTFGVPVTYAYDAVRRRVKPFFGAVDKPEPVDLTCTADGVQNVHAIFHQLVSGDFLRIFAVFDETAFDAVLDVGEFDAAVADVEGEDHGTARTLTSPEKKRRVAPSTSAIRAPSPSTPRATPCSTPAGRCTSMARPASMSFTFSA